MILLFADPVNPLKHLWLIGEGFLCSTLGTLQILRTELDAEQEPQLLEQSLNMRERNERKNVIVRTPYIYNNFKVKPYYQPNAGTAHGTLYKMYNSVVEALNADNKLPHYIVMLPDRDLILQLNYFKIGVGFILGEMIHWLAKKH